MSSLDRDWTRACLRDPSWAVLSACLMLSCGSRLEPCASATSCGSGRECLASRCVAEGGVPVDANNARRSATPSALAVASRDGAVRLGPSITLGHPAQAPTSLLMNFAPAAWAGSRVAAAFLLLTTTEGALQADSVELTVFRVDEAWESRRVAWENRPRVSAAKARGISRIARDAPLRIDVTDLVRDMADHPERQFGFAIEAGQTRAPGVSIETGFGTGSPPRLDVYLER